MKEPVCDGRARQTESKSGTQMEGGEGRRERGGKKRKKKKRKKRGRSGERVCDPPCLLRSL